MAGRSGGISKGVTFWGMVGATMTALKLKESWDEYRRVPGEEDGHGPLALHSPSEPPPSYRDDGDDLESAPLNGGLQVDTEIPNARPKRKASKGCCVCCGINCGLFWKAFGLVSMIFITWQIIRLVIWTLTPSPTGLENMPEFSKSLGCSSASHFFQDQKNIVYTVPVNPTIHEHRFMIEGDAVGTVTLAAGSPGDNDIKVDLSLRTDDKALFDQASVYFPPADEVSSGVSNSLLQLSTPRGFSSSCMRYDMTMFVPSSLKSLRIESKSVTQLKFDPAAKLNLDVLSVVMHSTDVNNLLLPTVDISAEHLSLELTRGYLFGEVSISDKTTLVTQRGDAIANVKIHPLPSLGEMPAVAELQTTTGAGRSDFFWIGNTGAPHRRIHAVHQSSRYGDLYLTYKQAEFNGRVDLVSKSYSLSGVQGAGVNRNGTELPWVGNKDGGDLIKVRTQNGWAGMYF